MVAIIFNGSALRKFLNDEDAFNRHMDESSAIIEVNSDGLHIRLFEGKYEVEGNPEQIAALYGRKLQFHCNESVNSDQFRVEMRNLLTRIADMLDACAIPMDF